MTKTKAQIKAEKKALELKKIQNTSRKYSADDMDILGKEISDSGKKTSTVKVRILTFLNANAKDIFTQAEISEQLSKVADTKEVSSIHVRNVLMGNSPEKKPNSPFGKGLVSRMEMPDGQYYYCITDTGKQFVNDMS